MEIRDLARIPLFTSGSETGTGPTRERSWKKYRLLQHYDDLNPWQVPDPELIEKIKSGYYTQGGGELLTPPNADAFSHLADMELGELSWLEWETLLGMPVETYTRLWRHRQLKERQVRLDRIKIESPQLEEDLPIPGLYRGERRTSEVASIDEIAAHLERRKKR